ncbi:unnamed protein product [Lactuca saligna]|uniref:F-box associated beta-propeller type 3 domain-containing protein n=1 Tax=Lactuca saligna TaxID=75948 RepID=A0AA35ZLX9_LACSI|nr:unnamed protein product [Lactuca saligna]
MFSSSGLWSDAVSSGLRPDAVSSGLRSEAVSSGLRSDAEGRALKPSIRRKVRVPECPRTSELTLGGIGFGFDPISDDYKIVWISYEKDSSFVYAVKTGTWCEVASPKPEFTSVLYETFLFNGVLHWEVTRDHIKSQDIYPPSYILTFDLSAHVFGMIPLPGPTWDWLTTGITTIQDSLALISYRMDVDHTWIRVNFQLMELFNSNHNRKRPTSVICCSLLMGKGSKFIIPRQGCDQEYLDSMLLLV